MINFLFGFVSAFCLLMLVRVILYRLNKKALDLQYTIEESEQALKEYKEWQEKKDI